MVSLVDIVPQTRMVEIAAGTIKLRGLGIKHIAALLLDYPELRKLWMNRGAPAFEIEALIATMPGAVGTIIAMAAGEEEVADQIIDALSLDDITECLIVVRDLTMPNGVYPFAEKLARLLGGGEPLPSGKAAGMNTPPPPSS
jgi:hypothetical protein